MRYYARQPALGYYLPDVAGFHVRRRIVSHAGFDHITHADSEGNRAAGDAGREVGHAARDQIGVLSMKVDTKQCAAELTRRLTTPALIAAAEPISMMSSSPLLGQPTTLKLLPRVQKAGHSPLARLGA